MVMKIMVMKVIMNSNGAWNNEMKMNESSEMKNNNVNMNSNIA